MKTLIGNAPLLRTLAPETFTDASFGVPTVSDILRELEKPGRDPRPAFRTASFREGVEKLEDLEPGMLLEGVVTNVAAFGAFVDIGGHQDGLVHISAMAKTFVKDPRALVEPGDIVRVKVLDIDPARRRNCADDAPRRSRHGGEIRTASRERAARRMPANQRGSAAQQSRSRRSGCGQRRHRRGLASCGLEAGQARFERNSLRSPPLYRGRDEPVLPTAAGWP